MIFKGLWGYQNPCFETSMLVPFSDTSSGTTFLTLLPHLGPSWPSMCPSWPPMGPQKGSQNHEKSTPEGVSKQGWSPVEAQGLPGQVWAVIWVPFLMVFVSTLGEFREGYSIKNSMQRSRNATVILHKKSEDVYFFLGSSVQVSHAARTAATSK